MAYVRCNPLALSPVRVPILFGALLNTHLCKLTRYDLFGCFRRKFKETEFYSSKLLTVVDFTKMLCQAGLFLVRILNDIMPLRK